MADPNWANDCNSVKGDRGMEYLRAKLSLQS